MVCTSGAPHTSDAMTHRLTSMTFLSNVCDSQRARGVLANLWLALLRSCCPPPPPPPLPPPSLLAGLARRVSIYLDRSKQGGEFFFSFFLFRSLLVSLSFRANVSGLAQLGACLLLCVFHSLFDHSHPPHCSLPPHPWHSLHGSGGK